MRIPEIGVFNEFSRRLGPVSADSGSSASGEGWHAKTRWSNTVVDIPGFQQLEAIHNRGGVLGFSLAMIEVEQLLYCDVRRGVAFIPFITPVAEKVGRVLYVRSGRANSREHFDLLTGAADVSELSVEGQREDVGD